MTVRRKNLHNKYLNSFIFLCIRCYVSSLSILLGILGHFHIQYQLSSKLIMWQQGNAKKSCRYRSRSDFVFETGFTLGRSPIYPKANTELNSNSRLHLHLWAIQRCQVELIWTVGEKCPPFSVYCPVLVSLCLQSSLKFLFKPNVVSCFCRPSAPRFDVLTC